MRLVNAQRSVSRPSAATFQVPTSLPSRNLYRTALRVRFCHDRSNLGMARSTNTRTALWCKHLHKVQHCITVRTLGGRDLAAFQRLVMFGKCVVTVKDSVQALELANFCTCWQMSWTRRRMKRGHRLTPSRCLNCFARPLLEKAVWAGGVKAQPTTRRTQSILLPLYRIDLSTSYLTGKSHRPCRLES